MRELIDVNSMAVCALQQGRPKRALDLPSAALASLKDHFANRQQQELVHESNSMSMSTPSILPPPPPPPPPPTDCLFRDTGQVGQKQLDYYILA